MKRTVLGMTLWTGAVLLALAAGCGSDDTSPSGGGNAGAATGGSGGAPDDAAAGGTGGAATGGEAGSGGVAGTGGGATGGGAGDGGDGGTANTGGDGGSTGGTGGDGGPAEAGSDGGPTCAIQTTLPQCDECINTQCYDQCDKCAQNAECMAIWTCIMQDCSPDGQPPSVQCAQGCATSHLNGLMDFAAFWKGLTPGCVATKCSNVCPAG
jgi:hypothetical protein